ncbi:MAG: phenylalanine--tRNA ligase subunit beta, partial [Bdellovibrio sp.]|nr:phenylalanine--tRNA ligase subunit beta [Bdellovibrio sp.]
MHISWSWISEFVDLTSIKTPEALAEQLMLKGLEIEDIRHLSHGLEKVITAQILEQKPHPQADRLTLCMVTFSTPSNAVEPLEIVCGAKNMKVGDKVALAQVGAHLTNGIKIERSKIRGVYSSGMLCSTEELKLEKTEGILILPPETPVGLPLAKVLGLDDIILCFKLTANRGDCLSHLGIAREVAVLLGQKLKEPEVKLLDWQHSPWSIHLEANESAPQFFGCFIDNVKIQPSPEWLIKRLDVLGFRAINNVVDATNLVMLEFGHPMHAYDAKLLKDHTIHVRFAKQGEKLLLLDGTTITLLGNELVIADGTKALRAIGLAGVMGGGNSEVQNSTTSVFLECAEFSPSLVRKTAFQHEKLTEASHRFERGVDPLGLPRSISRLANWIVQLAGGAIVGSGFTTLKASSLKKIKVSPKFFNDFLGTQISEKKSEEALKLYGCDVKHESDQMWQVTVPSFRLDLNLKEDLAEEVARAVGYQEILSTVPKIIAFSTPEPVTGDGADRINYWQIERIKDVLVQAGFLETINFAFQSPLWLKQFGFDSKISLLNPLSEELSALVPSLIPGLIKNAFDNQRHHFGSEPLALRLFELRPTYVAEKEIKSYNEIDTGVKEVWKLAFLLSGPRYAEGMRSDLKEVDFYDFKAIMDWIGSLLGIRKIQLRQIKESAFTNFLHPGQSVEVLTQSNKQALLNLGVMGLLHPQIATALKFRSPLWVAEFDLDSLCSVSRAYQTVPKFRAWPEHPKMERDFALIVKKDAS